MKFFGQEISSQRQMHTECRGGLLVAEGAEVVNRLGPLAHVDELSKGQQQQVVKAVGDSRVGLMNGGHYRPALPAHANLLSVLQASLAEEPHRK